MIPDFSSVQLSSYFHNLKFFDVIIDLADGSRRRNTSVHIQWAIKSGSIPRSKICFIALQYANCSHSIKLAPSLLLASNFSYLL